MSGPVRNVVIVGRDAAAWLTALGLRRAFGRQGVNVTVLELPSMVRSADVLVGLPTLEGLHRLLGLDTDDMLAATAGAFALGQQFANWSQGRPPFVHGYDTHGAPIHRIDFLQHWLKARSEGMNVPLEEFSLGAAAAKHGRFVVHGETTSGFSKARAGYHLDATAYVLQVRQRAIAAGVQRQAGLLGEVVRSDAGIASVSLIGGEPVTGDLFIDASGPDAVLIGKTLEQPLESWSSWFGCDRVLVTSGPKLNPLPAMSRISAFRAGWIGMFPLRDRTPVIAAYDSGKISDAEMLQNASVLCGMRLGDAFVAPSAPGMRNAPWTGNCVAIGEAAVALEPLDAAPLHMIHVGLSHLITLFPVRAGVMPEADPFNTSMQNHARNLRDFQIAHYRLNERLDEPFWDKAREAEPPPELATRLDLFAARGAVALFDDETFQEENWASVLIGHGLIPRGYDPQLEALASDELIQAFKSMLGFIAAAVRDMPSVEAQLELFSPLPSNASF
jgi:tryptophan halogenase